jgi:citrate lyase subunit beta/citryl-CoA lyase
VQLTRLPTLVHCGAAVTETIETSRLRRTLLFVPGSDVRKIEGARRAGADTLIFDLEDAVAPDLKVEARQTVIDVLRAGGFADAELAVRINAPETEHFEADLEECVAAGAQAIMLPKAESAEGLQEVEARIRRAEGAGQRVRILALVETARGIARAAALGKAAGRVDAMCFGHADFALDMGLTGADAQHGVVFHARCALAIAARATRVAPIDNVYLAVRDDAAFRADAELGVKLGYEGKLCIHPTQVRIANEVYTPAPEQIERAQRVVDAWAEARRNGRGVCTVDDVMVDAPVVALHLRVLARARRAGLA